MLASADEAVVPYLQYETQQGAGPPGTGAGSPAGRDQGSPGSAIKPEALELQEPPDLK